MSDLFCPHPFGQQFPITLPFPHGRMSYGGGGLGLDGYTTGGPTLFVVSSAPDDGRGWYCWACDDKGRFWGMSTHVSNSLLDENPWLIGWMHSVGILERKRTRAERRREANQ